MSEAKPVLAKDVAPRAKKTNYPEPYAARMQGRSKRVLGDLFGLANFGVNLTTLAPGGASALHHRHETQDEMIYIVSGRPTLIVGEVRHALGPGMVMGFPKGGAAHHIVNETAEDVLILEIGDRSAGDVVTYPDDDLVADWVDGAWVFSRKDGSLY